MALFDWLDFDENDQKRENGLSDTAKKDIIRKLLPLAADRCAPRFIRDVLIKSVYWKLVEGAKPAKMYEDAEFKRNVEELEQAIPAIPSRNNGLTLIYF